MAPSISMLADSVWVDELRLIGQPWRDDLLLIHGNPLEDLMRALTVVDGYAITINEGKG